MFNFYEYLEEKFRFTLKYHAKLNPKLWKHDQLKPGLRDQFLNLAYEFADFSGVKKSRIKDIIITGGNVNYNYTKFSDIDIHLMCNLTGLDSDALYAKKVEWTYSRSDKIAGYPLEFYAADASDEMPKGQGFYSIMEDKWLVIPKHLDRIEALEDDFVIDKIQYAIKYIRFLIKSGTFQQIERYKLKMHNMRSAGLQRNGEFSVENVMYKELRNRGWIDKLNAKHRTLKEYHEEDGGTFQDGGNHYDINKIFDITDTKLATEVDIDKVDWILPKHVKDSDEKRAQKVDYKIPIIVVKTAEGLLIVDGYHRLIKAKESNLTKLPAKYITKSELETTKLKG